MNTIEQKEIDELGEEKVVVLFAAQTQEGEPFHCYIQLTIKKLGEFTQAQQRGENMDLTTLGEIVGRGWGENPSQEEHAAIEAKYGEITT